MKTVIEYIHPQEIFHDEGEMTMRRKQNNNKTVILESAEIK